MCAATNLDVTLNSSQELDEQVNLVRYCDHHRFLLVEELAIEEDLTQVHYGKCTVIGRLHVNEEDHFELQNIAVEGLPSEYSLPEGTLAVRLLTFNYRGSLQSGKYCEVRGEVVLLNTTDPQANHIPLTARGFQENLLLITDAEQRKQYQEKLTKQLRPAIRVWQLDEIDNVSKLAAQNLVMRSQELEAFFEAHIQDLELDFEEKQQQSWCQHWNSQGEAIILEQWKIKYKDYLAEEDETVSETKNEIEHTVAATTEELTDTQSEDNAASWSELWEQHSEEVYLEQYILFTSIYYNYFLELKKALQMHTTAVAIATAEEQEEEEFTEPEETPVEDLSEQLRELGLPTSFGGRPQYKSKKRIETQHSTAQLYAVYFSDDEEDFDSITENEDDIVTEMSPHDKTTTKSDEALHELQKKPISKSAKRKQNRALRNVPDFLRDEASMLKYWRKRFSLFSRYDEGIHLDRESWFSVTPEKIAIHLAERLACDVLIDGFCGCGGNTIQFAKTCRKVIAIDIDESKLAKAKHNAAIYGVAHKIDFICGDFLQLCETGRLQGDVVFLSPPWGGPKYKKKSKYDIESHLLPVGATELLTQTRRISENIAVFLPRNADMEQVIKLAGVGNRCEVEHNYLDSRLVALTAIYGDEITKSKE